MANTKQNGYSLPLGLVLSGGGSRAAYQVGALKALVPYLEATNSTYNYLLGSSIGAVNSLVLCATLKHGLEYAVDTLEKLWLERNFKNSFAGSPSLTFFRSVKIALLKYAINPGPHRTDDAIFDPTPLMNRIDEIITLNGGTSPDERAQSILGVGLMTTMEGQKRKPILLYSSSETIPPSNLEKATFEIVRVWKMEAKHAFAAAALPTVLPPVTLDIAHQKVRFVDGGICQNVPVDPAFRVGAVRVIVIDISGRTWWFDRYGESHDKRPSWEVPSKPFTYCLTTPRILTIRPKHGFGKILYETVGKKTSKFIRALGPTWPAYQYIKSKLGKELAFEVMSYVALDREFAESLIELGYNETKKILEKHHSSVLNVCETHSHLEENSPP